MNLLVMTCHVVVFGGFAASFADVFGAVSGLDSSMLVFFLCVWVSNIMTIRWLSG